MGRHEQARPAAGAGGLSRAEQSGPCVYSTQCRRRHSRPATADQELFLALREYALDQPPAGGRSQGVRDRIPERARVHPTVCRRRRQDSRRHGYHRGWNAGPGHASRDGDAGRGRPHTHASAEGRDLLAGGTAARQERKPRHRKDRLNPRRQSCRSRGDQRGSFKRDLEHQEDRTGDEERALGRTGLPSGVFHLGPARPPDRRIEPGADDQRDAAESRAGRISARARAAGGKRVHDDVLGAGRRDLGQDDIPPSTAAGVRPPGRRSRAGITRPLQPSGAGAERRHYRLSQRCGARLQSAAGRRHLEHGLPDWCCRNKR